MRIAARDLVLVSVAVALGVLFRTTWHLGANFEVVTATIVVAAHFLRDKRLVLLQSLLILVLSDLLLGNSNILVFTWTGFLIPAAGNLFLPKPQVKPLLQLQIRALLSVLFFFLWTNFGVVLLTEMYSKDLVGLLHSYFNALPFLVNQLLASVVAVPLLFMAVKLGVKLAENREQGELRNVKLKS
jgi:hypothetical protein